MLKQLVVHFDPAERSAEFVLRCAAPPAAAAPECAAALLDTGDGTRLDLGTLCTPGALVWHDAPDLVLARHTYAADGPYTAALQWGSERLTAAVDAGAPAGDAPDLPPLPLFEVRRSLTDPYSVTIRVGVAGLPPATRVRVDTGSGAAHWLEAGVGERTFSVRYVKPGPYTVSADLVDAHGFRLGSLAQTVIDVGDLGGPEEVEAVVSGVGAPQPEAEAVPEADSEVPPTATTAVPWLPFRYARPLWAYTKTYKSPGGAVSRSLAPGTYLAIREERAVGGRLWYQTGSYDWVPASSVALVTPSTLRGVVLEGGEPEPEPEPGERRGVVTASVLNVRARPGVSASNPPVGVLRYGDDITIYEEAPANGLWYRIGVNRWVSAAYVRVLPPAPAQAALGAQAAGDADAVTLPALTPTLPIGWVVSSSLYVRSGPGTGAPVVGELVHNQAVNILETATVGGAPWYRVGPDQWSSGAWIGVARPKPRPASIRAGERWVGVSLKEQTAIAYEGDTPVYAALIASGLPGTPTVQGVFRTWWRVPSRKMSGPGYYLEEVTWTLYFYSAYALHTAYWHDAFGRPRSHGCVNLSPYDAWWIFQWSAPGGANAPAVYTYWA